MDNHKLDRDGASSFEAYFAEGDIDSSITVHEDGRIEISGVMTGEEAIHVLLQAAHRVRLFIERRALPATIEPLPPDDPEAKRDDSRDLEFDDLPSPPAPLDDEEFHPFIPPHNSGNSTRSDVDDIPF